MWASSLWTAPWLSPCLRVPLPGPASALWDDACSSWLDVQPKFAPENQTDMIPWLLACHLLAAAFQEANGISKSVVEHYGQQRNWECVGLWVNVCRGEVGVDYAITSYEWHWLLSFRTSKYAFLMMCGGYPGNPEAVCWLSFYVLTAKFVHCHPALTAKSVDLEMSVPKVIVMLLQK